MRAAAAVIPAHNEATTVADVAAVCGKSASLDEVIVVDNASTDGTATAAAAAGARVVHCREQGKGQAMRAGVAATDAEVILFLDADLLRLRTDHVDRLVRPVAQGSAAMTLGMMDRGPELNPLFINALPRLTGQRAVRRELFDALDAADIKGYKVEAALNALADELEVEVAAYICEGLWHRTKEEKAVDGAIYGTARKVQMLATAVWSYASYHMIRPVRHRLQGPRG